MNMSRLAYLITVSVVPTPLAAQGFDCARALTPVEILICAAPEIGALDSALNTAVRARLAAAPHERGDFLAASRRWLTERDKTCAVPDNSLSAERRATAVACLARAYRTRLDAIAAMPSPTTGSNANKALCHRFVERYRDALAARANDPADIHAPLSQSPFIFLSTI